MNVTALNNTAGALRSASEQIEGSSERLRKIWERDVVLRDGDLPEARKLLADIDEIMPGLDRFAARLNSIARPADPTQIAEHLIAIRLNFHNSKATGEGYGRIMTERVEARRPSFAALEWATRDIIDRRKFMPVTAEVLEAIDEAQRRVDLVRDIVATLPSRRERLAQRVAGAS
jgi:hypothetical protein